MPAVVLNVSEVHTVLLEGSANRRVSSPSHSNTKAQRSIGVGNDNSEGTGGIGVLV